MATSLQWTDGTGAATLDNGKPVPGDRFADWRPIPVSVARPVTGLGTGTRHEWRFRTDYGASFRLDYIVNTDLDLVDRLLLHLYGGGTVTVNTGDSASRTYTAKLAPDSDPTLQMMEDRALLEYSLSLSLINTAAAPMLCEYP